MAALGRILQLAGWAWLALGFVGPRLFGIDTGFGVFPGLILIFIARAVRTAAARRELPELQSDEEAQPESVEPAPVERQLNTERQREAPPPPPEPVTIYTEPEPVPESQPRPEPEPVPEPMSSDELLERIALAGRTASEDPVDADEPAGPTSTAMSSAEMIARARKRWDKKAD